MTPHNNGIPKVYLAIISILILESIAILRGIDGKCLIGAVAMIAGLGGFSLGRIRRKE